MRSQASYTCRSCLSALKTSRSPVRQSIASRTSQSITQRSIFTRAGVSAKQPTASNGQSQSRSVSFTGQTVKSEPPEIPTPAGLASTPIPEVEGRPLLQSNNLFHSFSDSPSPEIRRRAAFIKQNAYCSHPSHQQTRIVTSPDDPEGRKVEHGSEPPAHVKFECPDCGIPISCSEEHWADDYEAHLEICEQLREINEDDHDLHSGRFFPEFEYPGPQMEEAMINMTNWDTFLYSREFRAVNDERSLRQVTRLLTYPVTIGSVLHELSPYSLGNKGRMTHEGTKSFSALRYSLHPPKNGGTTEMTGIRVNPPPMRIFILGARAESSLPREVWIQLTHLFPRVQFHLIFIGPESMANRDEEFPLPERTPSNPYGAIVEDRIAQSLKISTFVEYYHTMHKSGYFYPYDPYFDCFMLFHPGLGHPASSHEWEETLPLLLETKVPILVTGYTPFDMERDIEHLNKTVGGEFDMLLNPGENIFRSLRWDLNDLDPQDISCGNWGLWAFRGKRYETTHKESA